MASLVVAELSVAFIIESCVRGHHVYQNTWAPIHREHLRCSRERGKHKSGKVVHVYDSVYSLLDQSSAKSIQRIFRCSPCNIKVESVQKYATAVAFGQDPTKVTFHQPSMRKHLVSCYMNKKMQPFPSSKI